MGQELPAMVPPILGARMALATAYARTGLDLWGLWLRYVALGGNGDRIEVDGYLYGLVSVTLGEHNVLACAVNERLDELGDNHARVPYCWRGQFGDPAAPGSAEAAPRRGHECPAGRARRSGSARSRPAAGAWSGSGGQQLGGAAAGRPEAVRLGEEEGEHAGEVGGADGDDEHAADR